MTEMGHFASTHLYHITVKQNFFACFALRRLFASCQPATNLPFHRTWWCWTLPEDLQFQMLSIMKCNGQEKYLSSQIKDKDKWYSDNIFCSSLCVTCATCLKERFGKTLDENVKANLLTVRSFFLVMCTFICCGSTGLTSAPSLCVESSVYL